MRWLQRRLRDGSRLDTLELDDRRVRAVKLEEATRRKFPPAWFTSSGFFTSEP